MIVELNNKERNGNAASEAEEKTFTGAEENKTEALNAGRGQGSEKARAVIDAMGEIDDRFLDEEPSEESGIVTEISGNRSRRYAAFAACAAGIVAVLALSSVMIHFIKNGALKSFAPNGAKTENSGFYDGDSEQILISLDESSEAINYLKRNGLIRQSAEYGASDGMPQEPSQNYQNEAATEAPSEAASPDNVSEPSNDEGIYTLVLMAAGDFEAALGGKTDEFAESLIFLPDEQSVFRLETAMAVIDELDRRYDGRLNVVFVPGSFENGHFVKVTDEKLRDRYVEAIKDLLEAG